MKQHRSKGSGESVNRNYILTKVTLQVNGQIFVLCAHHLVSLVIRDFRELRGDLLCQQLARLEVRVGRVFQGDRQFRVLPLNQELHSDHPHLTKKKNDCKNDQRPLLFSYCTNSLYSPGNPGIPGVPGSPLSPGNPGEPSLPGFPDVAPSTSPGRPLDPGIPGRPSFPLGPSKLCPGIPGAPESPLGPGKPVEDRVKHSPLFQGAEK